jgi:hypothetical protein
MGRSTSSDRILQHAQTLIAQLQADREVCIEIPPLAPWLSRIDIVSVNATANMAQLEGAAERPIIFLCHSLGGIIVKRVR